jgi:hypothetical protein
MSYTQGSITLTNTNEEKQQERKHITDALLLNG